MNRRGFLRGAISVMAMAAVLKGRVRDDGVMLNSMAHPHNPAMLGDLNPAMLEEMGERYYQALAKSMQFTREHIVADTYKYITYATRTFFDGKDLIVTPVSAREMFEL